MENSQIQDEQFEVYRAITMAAGQLIHMKAEHTDAVRDAYIELAVLCHRASLVSSDVISQRLSTLLAAADEFRRNGVDNNLVQQKRKAIVTALNEFLTHARLAVMVPGTFVPLNLPGIGL